MSLKGILAASAALLALVNACRPASEEIVDLGKDYRAEGLHAPWSGCDNGTSFRSHAASGSFFFTFEAEDGTPACAAEFKGERDVDPGDRVEIFFSPTKDLSQPYYCAEIDREGRVMDYKAESYRIFDFGWNFLTMKTFASQSDGLYRVGGSVSLEELRSLGLDLEGGFWVGVFQGDAASYGAEVTWYSLVPTADVEPDFHKEGVFFPCRITQMQPRKGVVVYAGDITTLGTQAWEQRIDAAHLDFIALHAATSTDRADSLERFVRSDAGRDFLAMCQRKGVGVEYEMHALDPLLPRSLFDEHPEYFRMDSTGVRVADYNMCFSNPEAVEAMRPQLEKALKWMKPTTHRYFLWGDDKQWKYCYCEHCRHLSPSEQTLLYENALLAMLREYDPEATLAHLAYHQTLPAPQKVAPADGVFLEFAPILRDYAFPLSDEQFQSLKENLLVFPAATQHILEYWLDESMNARWKRTERPALSIDGSHIERDILLYRSLGACSVTTFATWLDGPYQTLNGSALPLFESYATAFE